MTSGKPPASGPEPNPPATGGDPQVVLIVLDGWGYSPVYEGNAIAQATTPHFDKLWKSYPHALLQAAGEAVGLPWGEMGNSEVGHLNIGAGRIVPQDLPRISAAITDGSFYRNTALVSACEHVKTTGGVLHLIGLTSSGGVHSHVRHLVALVRLAKQEAVDKVYLHIFTDGRDAPPQDGIHQIQKLEEELAEIGVGRIASVSGRYYAMDRDRHWDRTERAFQAIARGTGPTAASATAAIRASYEQGKTDEFIEPTVIVDTSQHPLTTFRDADAAIFFNFRSDRTRQLTQAFVETSFQAFERGDTPVGLYFVTMTQYEKSLPVHVAFHPHNVKDSLAQVLSQAGVRQFHIAETEKYPHATFFFNGGVEQPNPLEERLLIASPKVATYDLEPAMSAEGITDELVKRIGAGDFPFIMVNYANADMVGHSGDFEATRQAVEALDRSLGRVAEAADNAGIFLIITADHGNAEQMINFTTGDIDTEHSTNPVPFILSVPAGELSKFNFDGSKLGFDSRPKTTGLLGDVAPTILKLFGIKPPPEMEGYGLL